jgi:hypothetical protein
MGLIYKPFGIIVGFIAGLFAKKAAAAAWGVVDDEEPPKATTRDASWGKVLFAAAVQGAVFFAVRVAVNRSGAKGFHYLTGIWPGEKRPDPA